MERLRVLVVDDEPGMQMGAQRVIRRHRVKLRDIDTEIAFDTEGASDLASARVRLETGGIDLVVLDYKLPDGSGLDLLREIRAKNLDLCVVMITAFASLDVAVSATKNGAFDFLSKPFSPEELESVITRAARGLLLERKARRLAEERRKLRLEFLSVLAHELKAPLGAIEGNLKLLDQRILGDAIAAYESPVKRAIARVEGMRKLILDLLDLTRIEAGQRKREIHTLDLREVARVGMETAQTEADKRGIRMTLRAPGRVEIRGDRSEMDIVLNNLVSNAVKYNRDGGEVTVELDRDAAGLVTVRVSDTGIGMTPAEAAKLFGEFVRIKNEKTMHIPGSGLGLSTVKKLAMVYGGDIAAQSEPDKGTTFTVTLRDAPDAVPAAIPAVVPVVPPVTPQA